MGDAAAAAARRAEVEVITRRFTRSTERIGAVGVVAAPATDLGEAGARIERSRRRVAGGHFEEHRPGAAARASPIAARKQGRASP